MSAGPHSRKSTGRGPGSRLPVRKFEKCQNNIATERRGQVGRARGDNAAQIRGQSCNVIHQNGLLYKPSITNYR